MPVNSNIAYNYLIQKFSNWVVFFIFFISQIRSCLKNGIKHIEQSRSVEGSYQKNCFYSWHMFKYPSAHRMTNDNSNALCSVWTFL